MISPKLVCGPFRLCSNGYKGLCDRERITTEGCDSWHSSSDGHKTLNLTLEGSSPDFLRFTPQLFRRIICSCGAIEKLLMVAPYLDRREERCRGGCCFASFPYLHPV